MTQARYAAAPGGKGLWVPITDDDRKRVIQSLPAPTKWVEAVILRESGDFDGEHGLERLWNRLRFRCSFEDFKAGLTTCYTWVETELENMALVRAGGQHFEQPRMDAQQADFVRKVMEEQAASGVG